MAKKQNYWYVLVLTDSGPVFVTKVEYSGKYAYWNKNEKPLEMSEYWAKDLMRGLMLNFTMAFACCLPYALDSQPYFYNKGHFEWVENEEEKEDEQ